MSKNIGSTILAVATGVIVGVGAGILFAPDQGKKTRKKIKNNIDKNIASLKNNINDMKDNIKKQATSTKETFEENLENIVSKSSYKADDIITLLEKKLADLKKANEQFKKQ